jgi:hypothetical protein
MVLYSYDQIYDFSSGVDTERLTDEIIASAIATSLSYINEEEGYVNIYFDYVLSGGDETLLDAIVAAHTGDAANPYATIKDEVGNEIKISDVKGHVEDLDNPHEVNKADIGLSNVTDDPQLKRSANDFVTFSEKTTIHDNDVFIIEDNEAAGGKKYVKYSTIQTELESGWTISETAPTSPGNGEGWYKPTHNTLYIWDVVRSKWLSESKFDYWFAYRSDDTEDLYLYAWGYMYASGSNRGLPIPFNMTLIAMYTMVRDREGTVNFRARKNNSGTNLATVSISSGNINSDFTLNVDLSTDDYLQCYLDGEECGYPYVVLKLARRGS